MSYTPSGINVSIGLLKNQGLDLHVIESASSAYIAAANAGVLVHDLSNALTVSSTFAPNNAAVNNAAIESIGINYLPGIFGYTTSGYLPTIAVNQAKKVFPNNDISSFIQNLFKCGGSATMTGDLWRTAHDLHSKSFDQFNATDFAGTTTGGIGEFMKVKNTNIAACGTEMKRMGYIVQFPDACTTTDNLDLSGTNRVVSIGDSVEDSTMPLSPAVGEYIGCNTTTDDLFNPVTFTQTLLNKGADTIITDFAIKLNDVLPYSVPSDLDQYKDNKFAKQKATALLKSIKDAPTLANVQDLLNTDLTTRSGKDPKPTVISLNDFLDMHIALPGLLNYIEYDQLGPMADFFMSPSFSGSITNFYDAGTLMEGMDDAPSIPTLNAKTHLVTSSDESDLKAAIPIFDDDNIGPTVVDFIGVVAGLKVGDALYEAANAYPKFLSAVPIIVNNISNSLVDLKADFGNANLVDQSYVTASLPSGYSITDYKNDIEANMSALINSTNGYEHEIALALGSDFANGATHYSHQVTSLSRMSIDLTQVNAGDKTTLISFGRSIGDVGQDPAINAILTNLASSNTYGDAIKAALTEKKNSSKMADAGLTIPNTLIPPNLGNVSPSTFT